jgi:hypothetical protein
MVYVVVTIVGVCGEGSEDISVRRAAIFGGGFLERKQSMCQR